jgi:hypothetical protein
MKVRPLLLTLLFALLVLLAVPLLFNTLWQLTSLNKNGVLSLTAPAFIGVAQANSESRAGTDFLSQQAGIAAYTNAGRPINIASVKPLFRGVERATDDYIIGSMKAPAYEGVPYDEEEVDPHAYIHKDGWVVAYYLKDTPAVHIVSWPTYATDKLTRNNLSDVISNTLQVLGVESFVIDYYDFRYPNADSLLIATDGETKHRQSDSFTIKVPDSLTVYERAWGFSAYDFVETTNCKLNETILVSGIRCERCWEVKHGLLTDIQLRPNVLSTVTIYRSAYYESEDGPAYCAIGLVYKEMP